MSLLQSETARANGAKIPGMVDFTIGRAIVNFKGPIVFCVISRYHGGAFVVFSKQLNPMMEIAAVEGMTGVSRVYPDNAAAVGLAAAIVSLGETLDLQVVAEGIEMPEQLASLLNLGCELATPDAEMRAKLPRTWQARMRNSSRSRGARARERDRGGSPPRCPPRRAARRSRSRSSASIRGIAWSDPVRW